MDRDLHQESGSQGTENRISGLPLVGKYVPLVGIRIPSIGPFVGHGSSGSALTRNTPLSSLQGGFTILELMAVLTVAAILLAIAVPNMRTLIQDNRIIGTTNELVASINTARAEAISRGEQVVLCRTVNALGTPPSCDRSGTSAQEWGSGWLVYVTPGESAQRDYQAGDVVLRRHGEIGNDVQVTSDDTGNNWLSFSPDGTLNAGGGDVLLAVCDADRTFEAGRLITVHPNGRAAVVETTSGNVSADCTPS